MKIRMILALCALTLIPPTLIAPTLIACRAVNKYAGHNGVGATGPPETTQPDGKTTMNSNLAAASNAFGFDLFQRLRREAANKNVFFSPLSVTVALAMTYNGAAGETKNAMARALKIEGMNQAELNRASAD